MSYRCPSCKRSFTAPPLYSVHRGPGPTIVTCSQYALDRVFAPARATTSRPARPVPLAANRRERAPFYSVCAISIDGVTLCNDCADLDDEPVEYRSRRPAHITHCGRCGDALTRRWARG